MTMGRPSKYNPEFCDKLIEQSKKGKLVAEICSEWGISDATFYDWAKKKEDFSDAYKESRTHMRSFYQKLARENFENKNFNTTLWSMFVQSLGITTRARTVDLLSLKGDIQTKNAPTIAKLLIKECACGNLSPQEAVNLITALSMIVKLEESVELKQKVDSLGKIVFGNKKDVSRET